MDYLPIIILIAILWVGYRIQKLHEFFIDWKMELEDYFGITSHAQSLRNEEMSEHNNTVLKNYRAEREERNKKLG